MNIEYLIEQFKSATGTTNFNIEEEICRIEFFEWLTQRFDMGSSYYTKLLDKTGLIIKEQNCVEVGKSVFDTVVSTYNTSIITPYDYFLQETKRRLILKGELKVQEGIPFFTSRTEKGIITKEILPNHIDTFITQNPYTKGHIQSWEDLHNNGINIAIGVYGHIYDKDKEEKLRMLRLFRGRLESDSKEEYATNKDGYYYVVTSSRYVRKLSKTHTPSL